MSAGSPLAALFAREWRIGRRVGGTGSMGVVFFLILVSIIPFAIGPDLVLLARIGPALLWIAALLATLLGLDRLFQTDEDDGSLDLLMTSKMPLELIVLVKCLVHWLLTGVPLVIATPVFAVMLGLAPQAIFGVTVSLLAGTPALTFVGAIGAALTVGFGRGGLLLAILVLPLCVPVLIFGVSAAQAAAGGTIPFATPFAILVALSLAALALAPFAAALALRQARI
jgi:heme exporter protein B